MQIILGNFKEGQVTQVENSYDPKELDLEFVDMKYSKPLDLTGSVEKGHDTLTFKGRLFSEIERTCGRCLKSVAYPLEKTFDLYYEIKGKDTIDTTDDLREVLILDHPISFLCRENCKGLCPHCGTNLNESACNCSSVVKERSFSALKDYWQQHHKENPHGTS